MDISILEEFVSLVETSSFQETAFNMNVSQSSLTKHIQKLESELGVSLFDRSARAIKVNEYGKTLYPYARQMLELSHDAVAALEELSEDRQKSFAIAYAPVLGQYGLVDLITEFMKLNPDMDMRTYETYQPLALLKMKKCDFAFLGEGEATDSNFNQMIYKTDHLAAVFPKDHKFADRESIMLEELADERFILHASVTNIPHEETQKFMELCEKKKFKPNIVAESQFTSTMIKYVLGDSGVAILNRLHIPTEGLNRCAVVDFYPTIRSYIYLLYRRKLSCPAATEFLHYMIEKISQN